MQKHSLLHWIARHCHNVALDLQCRLRSLSVSERGRVEGRRGKEGNRWCWELSNRSRSTGMAEHEHPYQSGWEERERDDERKDGYDEWRGDGRKGQESGRGDKIR